MKKQSFNDDTYEKIILFFKFRFLNKILEKLTQSFIIFIHFS